MTIETTTRKVTNVAANLRIFKGENQQINKRNPLTYIFLFLFGLTMAVGGFFMCFYTSVKALWEDKNKKYGTY